MRNQWANNLRKRMADHQEPSPKGLWNDIEKVIKKREEVSISHQERKVLWIRCISASVAAATLFLLIGYYFIDKTQLNTQFVVEGPLIEQNDLNENVTNQKTNSEIEHIGKKQKRIHYTNKNICTEAIKIDLSTNLSQEKYNENIENKNAQTDSIQEIKTQRKKQSTKEEAFFQPLPYRIKNTQSNKWNMSLLASNILSNSSSEHSGYGFLGKGTSFSCESLEDVALGDDPLTDILLSNEYKETYTDIKHKQPLKVGILLRHNLDKKWGLESGLTYTMLSSDLHSGSNNHYYSSKQTLHYIGIPLKLSYNIWENNRFSIYATGGGLVEKCVSGKLITNYILNDKKESSEHKKISIDQLQWSLNSSVGGQINLSEKIGLYVEPGVNYHFKDGSKIETIYKEKPLNFNFQLGFRVTLD